MSLRLACRRLGHPRTTWPHVFTPVRTLVTSPRPVVSSPRLYRAGLVAGGVLTASLVLGNVWGPVHADAPVAEAEKAPGKPQKPLSSLIRSYVVYSMCSIPALVDWAPSILATLTTIPGLKQVTEAIVRVTFFDQVRDLRCEERLFDDRIHCSVRRRRHRGGLSAPPRAAARRG